MAKQLWSEQDIRRVSAESLVDVRTIRRAMKGESIRQTSKERIRNAAKKLGLMVGFLALVIGCSSSSKNDELFGSGGEAGSAPIETGGAAGAGGEDSGASSFDATAEAVSCVGSPSGWIGCNDNGCGVCVSAVAEYLHYFTNHPGCWPNSGTSCTTGGAFACSADCPAPGPEDY